MAYLQKADFIKKIIKEELKFEERKAIEFINISTEIIEAENLKE